MPTLRRNYVVRIAALMTGTSLVLALPQISAAEAQDQIALAGTLYDFKKVQKELKELDKKAPDTAGSYDGHAKEQKLTNNDDKKEEKDKKDEKKDEKKGEKDTGVKVNGQTLWEDADGNRYYYVNGDKSSPFISVEQADGSFKWSTKDAMLNPPKPGEYGQIGMIESNGKLSTMYQLPDGSRAFSNGESWFKTNPGENSFTQTDKISFKDGSGTLTQSPRVGQTEPYKYGGGNNDIFGGKQPEMFPNNNNVPSGGLPSGGGAGSFTPSSAMHEFVTSPYGSNTNLHAPMQTYLNGLSQEGLNRFMADARTAAIVNKFSQDGGRTPCIGCGMGHLWERSGRNYR
jgi:hypothetical protein